MSDEELAAIEERAEDGENALAAFNHVPNVNFARLNIAASLADVPALVAEVRRLRDVVDDTGRLLDRAVAHLQVRA